MTVAGQPTINYNYDADSRLTDINTIIGGAAAGFSLNHDALGRRISLTMPNGITTTYGYDNASRLLNLNHLNPLNAFFESLNYTYDANGNKTSMSRPAVNLPLPNPATNITYNQANQMQTFNDKTITYDDNGNMTSVTNSCGVTSYSWDARNRLSGINGFNTDCSPLSASFEYDALNRRIEKTVNGKTIQYLYDGLDIVQEIVSGLVTANYVRSLRIDEPLALANQDGIYYYIYDGLGSVIGLADSSGNEVVQYYYDPYGNTTSNNPSFKNPFQYTGRENDDTGLYYNRNRYYSTELQRFINEDPIGLLGGINKFAYVGNNPINRIDPLGLHDLDFSYYGIDDPGHLVPGGGPTCLSALQDMAAVAMQVRQRYIPDMYGHCLAHCKVRKACGKGIGDFLSREIGVAKEAYDEVYGWIIGGRAWDESDIHANEHGRTCPQEQACEERCKTLWIWR